MKKLSILISLSILIFYSCQDKTSNSAKAELFEGELNFQPISQASFYGVEDSLVQRFEDMISNLKEQENISEEDKKYLELFETLKKDSLIYKPCFFLKDKSSKPITVYVDEEEYKKVSLFDRAALIKEGKKVEIVLEGVEILDGFINCKKIVSTKKVDGETFLRK